MSDSENTTGGCSAVPLTAGFGVAGKRARVLVVGAGKRSAAIAAALIAAGADVVQANEFPITRRPEITGVWWDECANLGAVEDKRKTYGPPKKGRGGKVRRW